MESEFDRKIVQLSERDLRYTRDAYYFTSEAVAYAVSLLPERRHVTAAELLDGIRDFAVKKFGAVAALVLADWGIKKEDDAGAVVYLMIEAGLLRASEDDSPEEFKTGNPLFPSLPVIRAVRRKSDKLPFID